MQKAIVCNCLKQFFRIFNRLFNTIVSDCLKIVEKSNKNSQNAKKKKTKKQQYHNNYKIFAHLNFEHEIKSTQHFYTKIKSNGIHFVFWKQKFFFFCYNYSIFVYAHI